MEHGGVSDRMGDYWLNEPGCHTLIMTSSLLVRLLVGKISGLTSLGWNNLYMGWIIWRFASVVYVYDLHDSC